MCVYLHNTHTHQRHIYFSIESSIPSKCTNKVHWEFKQQKNDLW